MKVFYPRDAAPGKFLDRNPIATERVHLISASHRGLPGVRKGRAVQHPFQDSVVAVLRAALVGQRDRQILFFHALRDLCCQHLRRVEFVDHVEGAVAGVSAPGYNARPYVAL